MIKLLFLFALTVNPGTPKDSLGLETINGKTFVIHRVEQKETLFAISRRYKTTVDAILQYNASAKDGLEIGLILKVPFTPSPAQALTVHKVQAGETLYSISRAYQVSADDIKRWNNLSDNTLSVGQELQLRKAPAPVPVLHEQPKPLTAKGVHTVEQGQTLFAIARQHQVSVDDLRKWNNLDGSELKIGQTLIVSRPDEQRPVVQEATPPPTPVRPEREETPVVRKTTPATTPTETNTARNNSNSNTANTNAATRSSDPIRISEPLKSGDEIVQAGLAELIEGTEGNRKYLALHRTAPIGTILKVRNEMNNREVFVRVMGKLPDTAMTDKLLIKISKSAYDRLGAIDPRFRVQVTYYK